MAGSLATPMVASSSGLLAGVVQVLWELASSVRMADVSSRGTTPLNTSLSEKEGNTSSLLPAPLYSLLTGLASLQQADQLSLPNTGGLRHMPPSSLIAFLGCPNRQRWWQEVLLEKTWQCRWGLMVVLHLVQLDCPYRKPKQGLHLLCQLLMVFYLWYWHQLPPPARHFADFSLPHHPLLELFHWGHGRRCLLVFFF